MLIQLPDKGTWINPRNIIEIRIDFNDDTLVIVIMKPSAAVARLWDQATNRHLLHCNSAKAAKALRDKIAKIANDALIAGDRVVA